MAKIIPDPGACAMHRGSVPGTAISWSLAMVGIDCVSSVGQIREALRNPSVAINLFAALPPKTYGP